MKLTIAKLERFASAITDAAEIADEIYEDSEDGDMSPEEAAAALALVIEKLQTAIVEVES
jgi:hypothetical protein